MKTQSQKVRNPLGFECISEFLWHQLYSYILLKLIFSCVVSVILCELERKKGRKEGERKKDRRKDEEVWSETMTEGRKWVGKR